MSQTAGRSVDSKESSVQHVGTLADSVRHGGTEVLQGSNMNSPSFLFCTIVWLLRLGEFPFAGVAGGGIYDI